MPLINGHHYGGWRPGPRGHGRLRLGVSRLTAPRPRHFSLRPLVTILDQGQTGTCTAFSHCGARVTAQRARLVLAGAGSLADPVAMQAAVAQTIPLPDPAPYFLYYNTEDSEGDPGDDNGATIGDTCTSDNRFGICHEATWPTVDANFLTKPSDAAYAEALGFAGTHDEQVEQNLDILAAALMTGRPVQFGAQLTEGFEQIGPDGIYRPSGAVIGGHAEYVVGWDDDLQRIEVANSWGTGFGDAGFVWFPYNVFFSDAVSEPTGIIP